MQVQFSAARAPTVPKIQSRNSLTMLLLQRNAHAIWPKLRRYVGCFTLRDGKQRVNAAVASFVGYHLHMIYSPVVVVVWARRNEGEEGTEEL